MGNINEIDLKKKASLKETQSSRLIAKKLATGSKEKNYWEQHRTRKYKY